MRKLILTILTGLLLSSCCLSQIPTQYAYVDEFCQASLPDYTSIVIASDNCGIVTISQLPAPGEILLNTINVEIQGIDEAGNITSMFFDVVLLDTIAPTMQLDPEWTGYTDDEVGDMYRTFYGWIQLQEHKFRDNFPFEDGPLVGFEKIDLISDTYMNIITVPDTIHNEWWWAGDVIVTSN